MKKRFPALFVSVLLLLSLLSACKSEKPGGSVVIASKQFTENMLLSEMYAQLIENRTDLEVVRKQNLGATAVCFSSMENNEIDIYVEYTGTIYNQILGYEYSPETDSDALYELIRKKMNDTKNITLFQPIGLNNTYALAMPDAKAQSLEISTLSDLALNAPKLVFAANDLFFLRINDGYDALVDKYGLMFKSVVKMNNELLFEAAADDQIDVIVVYATDSLLPKYDMIVLQDDKHLFPDYYALPIIRNDVLSAYPELNDVLNLLADRIDDKRMQELNYLVDIENHSPGDVAKAFLVELGLL